MTSAISAPLAASEPAMTRTEWISGSAATASSACGRSASDSARNAVVGVRSTGFAAVATEMSSGRSRSTPAALSGGAVRPNCAHWSTARTPLPPPKVTMPTPGPGRQPVPVPLQQERDVDQLLDRVHADHAQLAQHGVDHALLADEGAGVGLGGAARSRSSRRP